MNLVSISKILLVFWGSKDSWTSQKQFLQGFYKTISCHIAATDVAQGYDILGKLLFI